MSGNQNNNVNNNKITSIEYMPLRSKMKLWEKDQNLGLNGKHRSKSLNLLAARQCLEEKGVSNTKTNKTLDIKHCKLKERKERKNKENARNQWNRPKNQDDYEIQILVLRKTILNRKVSDKIDQEQERK